jgi:hypothetical protein
MGPAMAPAANEAATANAIPAAQKLITYLLYQPALSLTLARQGIASFWTKQQKLWLFGIGVSISVTL